MKPPRPSVHSGLSSLLLATVLILGVGLRAQGPSEQVEILRDRLGIAHVFGQSVTGCYYGFGWSEAEDQAPTVWRSILAAQGRMAEWFGPSFVSQDVFARGFDHSAAAQAGWSSLSSDVQRALNAWATGFNDFVASNPRWTEPYQAPITGQDLVAVALMDNVTKAMDNMTDVELSAGAGSNAAAVDGSLTARGYPMLYADPHVPWTAAQRQIHLSAPGFEVFDSSQGPFLRGGYANGLASGGTHNPPDGGDVYEELLDPQDPSRYLDAITGQYEPFFVRTETIAVLGAPAEVFTLRHTLRQGANGPEPDRLVLSYDVPSLRAWSIRIAVEDRVPYVDQVVRFSWSGAIDRAHQVAMEPENAQANLILADDQGHIAFFYTGRIPLRPTTAPIYGGILDGWDPLQHWLPGVWDLDSSSGHTLPLVIDPQVGWIQSSNDNPSYVTAGPDTLPTTWPNDVVPLNLGPTPRGLRIRALLSTVSAANYSDLHALAFDTTCLYAQHFVAAINRGWAVHGGNLGGTPDALTLDAHLRAWDGRAEVDSVGMTVMFHFRRQGSFQWPDPAAIPTLQQMQSYLSRMDQAAQDMRAFYGGRMGDPLSVPWGKIHYILRGGHRFGLAGGTRSIPAPLMAHMGWSGGVDKVDAAGDVVCIGGSSFVHGHELDPHAPKMWSITPQGQGDPEFHPDSPHVWDQAGLFANKMWVRQPRTRREVLGNLCPFGGPNHEHAATLSLPVPPGL